MKKIKILLVACTICLAASTTFAQVSVGITVGIAPPALPVYVQPACPVDGYLWQPGYWAYDPTDGYYWVPGVWVAPPTAGLYWTPAYWGYAGGSYGFHAGYWGPHVGFYGGINYGYGYGGVGFVGGGWSGGHFRYNTAVVNVNRTVVHNTYVNRTVIVNNNNHTSFNGPGGVNRRPNTQEQAAMRDHHVQATSQQLSHQQSARSNKSQFASVNHGRPAAPAMNRVNGKSYSSQGRIAKNTPAVHTNTPNHVAAVNHATTPAHSNTSRPANHENQAKPVNHEAATRPQQHTNMQASHSQHTNNMQASHNTAPRPQPQQHVQQQQHAVQHTQAAPVHHTQPAQVQHAAQPRPQPQQAHMQEPQHAPQPQPQHAQARPQPQQQHGGERHK